MEEIEQEGLLDESMFDVNMSPSVIYSLSETCRWARRLVYIAAGAILAILIIYIADWEALSRQLYLENETASMILIIIAIFFGGVYIAFLALLFIFSGRVKEGLQQKDLQKVEHGFMSLKVYFIISVFFSMLIVISFVLQLINIITS
ncbi:MAG TPA: hypothetical protein VG738_04085 [Chitinophagaceae bacterium]|nr:hypothetical protein [Chitinophagaceae bacterium]